MSFGYRHKKEILICIILIILLGCGGVYFYKFNLNNKDEKKITEDNLIVKKKNSNNLKKKTGNNETLYKVDIKGEINNPGIYALNEGQRVIDVINSAGGLTENADTTVINLSKKIKDEMVIIIYSKEEVADFKKTTEVLNQVLDKCYQKDETSLTNDACVEKNNTNSQKDTLNKKVNINTATTEELKQLPGIGDAKAQNIIKYREEYQKFSSIEEVKQVEGIGDSLYAQIEAFITIE